MINLHHKQSIAIQTPATEVLFGGGAGPGKSFLLRVAAISWATEIPNLQIYLFRRLSDDLYKNHMSGSGSFLDLMDEWIERKLVRWHGDKNFFHFWNDARIWLCHCQYEKDVIKYQGSEIGVLLLDEATHFTPLQYRYLRGRVRLGSTKIPDHHKGTFPRILCASNPGGISHTFFKSQFIDIAPPFQITRMPKEEGGFLRQYIPALLHDNPTLLENDPDYAMRLQGLGDPVLVRAMLEGDWNIVAGGALDDLWGPWCILPRFPIPSGWKLDRSFDWGSAHPFSVCWWAQSNGEEVDMEDGGEKLCLPRGSIILFGEWYGAESYEENKGLKLGAAEVADGILLREQLFREDGWIHEDEKIHRGPADGQIYNVNEKSSKSIAIKMKDRGVEWVRADKSQGSRVNGLQLVRDMLKASKPIDAVRERPGLFFMDHCRAAISTLPVLPRDPLKREDVDTKSIDHVYDAVKYKCLAVNSNAATKVDVSFPA